MKKTNVSGVQVGGQWAGGHRGEPSLPRGMPRGRTGQPGAGAVVGMGVPGPTGKSRMDTYRGQTNSMARSPSGMKLTVTVDDFISSFIFRKMEQLEAMAVTCHTPANCSRTSPVGFEKDVGTLQGDLHPP